MEMFDQATCAYSFSPTALTIQVSKSLGFSVFGGFQAIGMQ